jgi:hypothetical protein
MDELLDEGKLDPKKFFDKEQYNTLTLSLTTGSLFKENDIDVIISLLDPNIEREDKDAKLAYVKEKKLNNLLMKAVTEAEADEDRAKLLAVCWESGLDFRNDFLFFVEFACNKHYMTALEAATVVENTEDIKDEAALAKAIEILDNCKKGNKQIISDLRENILSRTN